MISDAPHEALTPAMLPLTALSIGLWEDDIGRDCIRGDAVMARLFGLSEADAAAGIPWRRLISIFHPDDLAREPAQQRRVREVGGLFVWEHRIVPEPGVVRWVLARGCFERSGPGGAMRGRGIVIDITESRMDGRLDGPARLLTEPEGAVSPLERLADQAIALWNTMLETEPRLAARLEPPLRTILTEIGRQLAATMTEGRDASSKHRRTDPKLH